MRKNSKSEADIIVRQDCYSEQLCESDIAEFCENDSENVQHIEPDNSSNQLHNEDWSDQQKRKMCLKLNLSNEIITEKNNCQRAGSGGSNSSPKNNGIHRKGSVEGSINCKLTKTPSSIPRELIGETFTPSPTLARSPAMHEGFRTKDWKVERTPINTPDNGANPPLRLLQHPQLSDDEDEEETDSVNSETDPISKGSGTSSFLPSSVSVDVSESRTGSNPDKETIAVSHIPAHSTICSIHVSDQVSHMSDHVTHMYQHQLPAQFTDTIPDHTEQEYQLPPNISDHVSQETVPVYLPKDTSVSDVAEHVTSNEYQHPVVTEQETKSDDTSISNLVKPPEGFTDSPIKQQAPTFDKIDDSVIGSLSGENEILMLETVDTSVNPIQSDAGQEVKMCENQQKAAAGNILNQEKFSLKDAAYHHPELVVCTKQGTASTLKCLLFFIFCVSLSKVSQTIQQ